MRKASNSATLPVKSRAARLKTQAAKQQGSKFIAPSSSSLPQRSTRGGIPIYFLDGQRTLYKNYMAAKAPRQTAGRSAEVLLHRLVSPRRNRKLRPVALELGAKGIVQQSIGLFVRL